MKLAYIDCETTGLKPNICAITQLACIVEIGGKEFVFDQTARPHDNAEVTPEALQVQQRSLDELLSYQSHEDLHRNFVNWLDTIVDKFKKTDKLHFVAYNASFDDSFLRALFRRNSDRYYGSYFWWPYIDVMTLAAHNLAHVRHELPNMKLTTVYKHVMKKDLQEAHDALADIRATKELFETFD